MGLEKVSFRFRLAVQNRTARSDVARLVLVQNLKDGVACHMRVCVQKQKLRIAMSAEKNAFFSPKWSSKP